MLSTLKFVSGEQLLPRKPGPSWLPGSVFPVMQSGGKFWGLGRDGRHPSKWRNLPNNWTEGDSCSAAHLLNFLVKVLNSSDVRDVLSLMYSCGMYNYSGQFAFKVVSLVRINFFLICSFAGWPTCKVRSEWAYTSGNPKCDVCGSLVTTLGSDW